MLTKAARRRVALAFLLSFSITGVLLAQKSGGPKDTKEYQEKRFKMVREAIEREGINNPRVLEAMRTVPRHEFVLSKYQKEAYVDTALPIGFKQTISPPFVVAYMTQEIDPQRSDRILEIGTGSGYQASILAQLCKEVYTIEIVQELGEAAEERMKKLGYDNVFTKVGDGYQGWPGYAPFDKIIVTCSPENVPQPLIEQLKDGGMMLIPLGERYQQVFHKFEKKDGKLTNTRLIPTLFVPMTGKSEDIRQVKPDPLSPKLLNGSFEELNEEGKPAHWHYQRLMSVDTKEAQDGNVCVYFENKTPGRMAQALQAMAVDGKRLGSITVQAEYKLTAYQAGEEFWEVPGFVAFFYDEDRKSLDSAFISWTTIGDWRSINKTIAIPPKAREMIVKIGLTGAKGQMWVDNVRLTFQPRL